MAVFKRGDVYHYQFMVRGERYRGSTKQTTPGKARTFESMLMSRIAEGKEDIRMKKAPLLSEIAMLFLKEVDARAEAQTMDGDTKRHYHNGWRLLEATDIKSARIDQITTGIAASLSFPGGPWNARAGQQVLGRLLSWAADNGYLRAAPRIKRTKAAGRVDRIEPRMEQELLKHLDRDVADVFQIMMDCGMRPEEVMRMRWEHVSWVRSEYFNPFGKTAASRRYVPIPDRMKAVLRYREETKTGPWVFPGDTKAGHRSTVAKKWEEGRKKAGLDPKIVLYLARHEFATSYLESGGDLATLSKILGHTSIAVTAKYLHPGIKGATEVINRRNSSGLQIVKRA